ncbi:putative 2,4-dienoyl-CoA reductase [Vreelandella titanicae]
MEVNKSDMTGKSYIITGAESGIGLSIAKMILSHGGNVVIHYLHDSSIEKELKNKFDRSSFELYQGDFSDLSIPEKLFKYSVERFGHISGIVNNAATGERGDVEKTTAAKLSNSLNINLISPYILAREFSFHIKSRKSSGVILNIGSINAYCGEDEMIAYATSKGGLMTLTKAMAQDLISYNIRVNLINVGWTATSGEVERVSRSKILSESNNKVPKSISPRGSLLTPVEVARHVFFWISDSSYPANGVIYELEQYPFLGRNMIPYVCD